MSIQSIKIFKITQKKIQKFYYVNDFLKKYVCNILNRSTNPNTCVNINTLRK